MKRDGSLDKERKELRELIDFIDDTCVYPKSIIENDLKLIGKETIEHTKEILEPVRKMIELSRMLGINYKFKIIPVYGVTKTDEFLRCYLYNLDSNIKLRGEMRVHLSALSDAHETGSLIDISQVKLSVKEIFDMATLRQTLLSSLTTLIMSEKQMIELISLLDANAIKDQNYSTITNFFSIVLDKLNMKDLGKSTLNSMEEINSELESFLNKKLFYIVSNNYSCKNRDNTTENYDEQIEKFSSEFVQLTFKLIEIINNEENRRIAEKNEV